MTHNEFNHIVASLNTLSPEQMQQLRRELESKMAASVAASPDLTPDEAAEQEMQRRLVADGVLSEIKPPRRFTTPERDPYTPVPIAGEPLSETVIRERR